MCIVYRICLKAIPTICHNAKIILTKGKTIIFQIDSHKSNLSIPKLYRGRKLNYLNHGS